MELLPTPTEAAAITDVAKVREFTGLQLPAWQAVDTLLGGVPSIRVLATLPASSLRGAIQAARVTTDASTGAQRPLKPVEITQVGLMWRAARCVMNLDDSDPLDTTVSLASSPSGPGASSPGPSTPLRKVKMNSVIDQVDEAEVTPMKDVEMQKCFGRLSDKKGGAVRPEVEPTEDQFNAMHTRVVDMGCSPYADFAVFTPFHMRFLKAYKFMNHILQPDGTYKPVEVPGPPNFDAWEASWKVFANTLLGLEVEHLSIKYPVVSQAALEEYHDRFRDLVVEYPTCWHLAVTAEDRCRAEHMPRLKRLIEEEFRNGLAPTFKQGQPWETVFKRAAKDRDYWDQHVRHPALKWMAAGGSSKGPTGSLTDLTNGQELPVTESKSSKKRKKARENTAALKAEVKRLKTGDGHGGGGGGGFPPPPGKGKGGRKGAGKGEHPKKDARGRFITDRDGNPLCFGFSNGTCKDVCPKGMKHLCQNCLGTHSMGNCKKQKPGANM